MSGLAAFITKRQQKQDFFVLVYSYHKPKVCLSKIIRTKIYNWRDYVTNYLNDIEKCVTISRIRKIKLSLVASGTSRHSPNKRQKMWHYHVHCMEKSQCDRWKLLKLRHSSHTYNYNATLLQKQPETPSSIARAIKKVQKWLRAQFAAEKKRLHKKIKTQTQSKTDDDNILGVSKRVVWELLAFPVLPSPAVMVQSCWEEQECRSTADRSTDRSALTEVSATSLSVYLTVLPQKWLLCFAPSLALVDLSLHSLSLCSLLPCLLPWKNSLSLSICL